jgi:hypothetical protein
MFSRLIAEAVWFLEGWQRSLNSSLENSSKDPDDNPRVKLRYMFLRIKTATFSAALPCIKDWTTNFVSTGISISFPSEIRETISFIDTLGYQLNLKLKPETRYYFEN